MEDPENEPLEEYSLEDLDRIFNDAIKAIERLHKSLSESTQDAGLARQIIITSYPRYTVLFNKAEEDPSVYPMVSSGLSFVEGLTIQFNALSDAVGDLLTPLGPVVNSASSFSGSTDSATGIFALNEDEFEPLPVIPTRGLRADYSAQLRTLDESLADSYDQVWQTLYGTSADRFRASLFMMRQVYDHFFSHLAPDDLVRESPYWTEKAGEKPNQIYRSERVQFAAQTHVKDPDRARTLAASAKQINELYEAANRAHKRGALNPTSAQKAVIAMDSMLKDWIDAIS